MKVYFKIVVLALVLCMVFASCANPVPLAQNSQQSSTQVQEATSSSTQSAAEQSAVESEVQSSSIAQDEPVMAYSATLDDIIQRGTLIIGVDESFSPISYIDESGNYAGLDIDIATEICSIIGVEPEFVSVPWAQKEQMLNSGEVDCLMSGLAITQNRSQSMNFTRAYLNNMYIVLTKQGVSVSSVADLAGLSIGVQEGRTIIEVAQSSYIYDSIKNDIIEYPSYEQAFDDMQSNVLDCIIVPSIYGMTQNMNLGNIYTVSMLDFGDAPVAIGTRKTDIEISTAIDEALASVMESGKLEELNMKHFNMDIFVIR